MANPIDNSEDIIDSREVIERIAELEATGVGDLDENHAAGLAAGAYDEDDIAEWKTLTELASEARNYSEDWEYGATLIRDSYFVEYAQDLAEDCGMIPSDLSWPCTCIDWERAARELQMDYTSVDFDGVTYWVR